MSWLFHTLLTMLLWGIWGAMSKPVSTALSSWEVQTFSVAGLMPVIVALALYQARTDGMRFNRGWWYGFIAGVVGSMGNLACFQAMNVGGKAAAVIPLTSLYPLVTVVLAHFFLKEKLQRIHAAGIGLSLAAIYCFNGGGAADWVSPWLAFSLIPIGLWGWAALWQKMSTQHASNAFSTLAFLAGYLPSALIILLIKPIRWEHSGSTWMWVLLLGFFLALGNLTLICAYGSGGKASIVTPASGMYALVTIPLAVAFLGEKISAIEWCGIGLALLAVVALCREAPAPGPEPARE